MSAATSTRTRALSRDAQEKLLAMIDEHTLHGTAKRLRAGRVTLENAASGMRLMEDTAVRLERVLATESKGDGR